MLKRNTGHSSNVLVQLPTVDKQLKEERIMSTNMEKMKQLFEAKKAKKQFLEGEKKVGVGWVEKMNKSSGNGPTRTKRK